jgi:DNA-binding IclR family transcriptional regulator
MTNAETANRAKPMYPIGSVDSAIRLLMMIGERDRVRIAEAAKELGVARSTAHWLMQMLVYRGLVRQDPESKAYTAGSRLTGLGLQLVRKLDVRRIAHPYMEALADEVGETINLFALQAERSVLCLTSVETKRVLRVGSRTGVVLTAAASASGRAVLSTLPEADLLDMYPSPRLPKHEYSTVTLRSQLLDRLADARRLGYAVQREESEPGVSAIAAPIRIGDQVASFALSAAMPTSRLDDRVAPVIGAAVVKTVGELAGALGFY